MDRRTFVRLLAAASATAASSLDVAAKPRSRGALQTRPSRPTLKVVSRYVPAAAPGMPGPYPGRIVAVTSAGSVDTATGAANADAVREMMARGMRALTGAASTAD